MSARSGILAGGSWVVDKLKIVDVYPRQDALANILGESIGNGGSPFNILIGLAKLGAKFPLAGVGKIGADSEGQWILEQCAAHGVEGAGLRIQADVPTSYTDVMIVRGTGRRTFFHQRGANAHLGAEDFSFATVTQRIFHLGYLLLLDELDRPDPEFGTVAAKVLSRARQAGCRTSIDLVSEDSDRFASVVLPALPQVDYCLLNELELERTTGVPTRPDGEISFHAVREACRILLEKGVQSWVVVHFPEGAYARGKDGSECRHGSVLLPQDEIVSAVGAGDAFAAGVLYALHEELPIAEALRHGVTAAAASLRGAGTSDGLGNFAECLTLGDRLGFRGFPAD